MSDLIRLGINSSGSQDIKESIVRANNMPGVVHTFSPSTQGAPLPQEAEAGR